MPDASGHGSGKTVHGEQTCWERTTELRRKAVIPAWHLPPHPSALSRWGALSPPPAPPRARQPSPSVQRSRGAALMPRHPTVCRETVLKANTKAQGRVSGAGREARPRGTRVAPVFTSRRQTPSPCRGGRSCERHFLRPLADGLPTPGLVASGPRRSWGASDVPGGKAGCGAPSVLGLVGTGRPPPAGADPGQR